MIFRKQRIVYLQYTNPAGYPPLEHSSRILADRGWDVLFLGAAAHGANMLSFPPHPSIRVRRMPPFGAGLLQKLNYFAYAVWTAMVCLTLRPSWIYVSEPMAAGPALLLRWLTRTRVLYHEHDSPSYGENVGFFQRLLSIARRRLARNAELCVLPQEQRIRAFIAETGRKKPTHCVWNCPRLEEIASPRLADPGLRRPMQFYYHGSLNRERLPFAVLDALARVSPTATLTVVGYETVGSVGYVNDFMAHASRLALADRVRCLGALSCRSRILAEAACADVGLSFMPLGSREINMAHMTGASNKPFDYMAVGLMLLVSDLPEWREMYVKPGYARACDPGRVESLAPAMAWCIQNPARVREMGEAGRQRIAAEWNYERQFLPLGLAA
jgi:glycosyltransferase involved in cell wall biosynthesis